MIKKFILRILPICSVTFAHQAIAADDIGSILNEIKAEKSGSKNTTIGKPPELAPTAPKKAASPKAKAPKAPKVKKSKSSGPQIQVWNPRDKLPKNVTGNGVAGNFTFYGTNADGNPIYIPAEDFSNPFARQFWVVNVRTGLGPNFLVPINERRLIKVSRNKPLIIIGRGIVPGVYNVQAQ
jgi:hypothetical protein